MTEKKLKLLQSPLIAVGLLFLINPTVSLFDILPDFIGYILIWFGLSELARMDDRLTLASQKLLYLAGLSFLRLIAAVATLGYDSSTIMMFCFVFAIAECVLIAALLGDLFDGLDYVLERFGGFAALSEQSNTRFLTSVFFFSKIALGFIPELSAIFELRAYYDIDKSPVWKDLAGYKPYEILLFGLIILVLGIFWYRGMLVYFRAIRHDTQFMTNAGDRYAEVFALDPSYDDRIKRRFAGYCVTAGFVFWLDLTLDGKPLLPAGIGTLLLFAAYMLLRRYARSPKLWIYAVSAAVCQTAFEIPGSCFAVTDVVSMKDVPGAQIAVLSVLGALYAASSVLFLLNAEKALSAQVRAITGSEPYRAWRFINIAYYVYLAAYIPSFIIPVAEDKLFTAKFIAMTVFVILAVREWFVSVRQEED